MCAYCRLLSSLLSLLLYFVLLAVLVEFYTPTKRRNLNKSIEKNLITDTQPQKPEQLYQQFRTITVLCLLYILGIWVWKSFAVCVLYCCHNSISNHEVRTETSKRNMIWHETWVGARTHLQNVWMLRSILYIVFIPCAITIQTAATTKPMKKSLASFYVSIRKSQSEWLEGKSNGDNDKQRAATLKSSEANNRSYWIYK